MDKVIGSIMLLARYPLAGRSAREFGPKVRRFTCAPYLIYYRPRSSGIRILQFFTDAENKSCEIGQPANIRFPACSAKIA
jgi:plasmid stabilization system protein ParE